MTRPRVNFECSVENCDKPAYAKGYCRQHWWRLKTYGRLEKIRGIIKGNCTIWGCDKKIKGLGLCRNHYSMFKTYKIHPNEYNQILKNQNGVCAICGEKETSLFHNIPGKVKLLAVDHCHNSDKVRGLLCWRCNSVLGRLSENLNLIQSMIDYLTKHKELQNG